MFARNVRTVIGENNNGVPHKELQHVNTRVSEYLRKYGQGKLDKMPTTNAPEVKDDRSVDQMLDEPLMAPGTDPVEVLSKIQEMLPKYQAARDAIAQNQKDRDAFDKAVKVLQDKNSEFEEKRRAMLVLDELRESGKVTKRTRARD